jgi:hypothetical protein
MFVRSAIKSRNRLGRDFYPRAALRVARYTGLPLPRAEAPEAADLHLAALLQGTQDAAENCLDDQLAVFQCKFERSGDVLNKIRPGHG